MEWLVWIKDFLNKHGAEITAILTFLTTAWQWLNTRVALAISQADKNDDGTLDNDELETMAIGLIRTSGVPILEKMPEPILRGFIDRLCRLRRKKYATPSHETDYTEGPPPAAPKS